jgi:hypothetical protein
MDTKQVTLLVRLPSLSKEEGDLLSAGEGLERAPDLYGNMTAAFMPRVRTLDASRLRQWGELRAARRLLFAAVCLSQEAC